MDDSTPSRPRPPMLPGLLGLALVLPAGCEATGTLRPGQDGLDRPLPCADDRIPDGCGRACTADSLCAVGLFCEAGACVAECLGGDDAPTDLRCPGDEVCDPARGRCTGPDGLFDAGPRGDAGDDDCAEITLDVDTQTPTVVLVVDRSTSMTFPFRDSGIDRWDALFDALFAEADPGDPEDPGGVVGELQDRVRFAMFLYTGEDVLDPENAVCPALRTVDPGIGNAGELARVFQRERPVVDSNTPTSEAIDAVLARTEPSPDGPTLFLLATDGLPDLCATPTERNRAARVASIEAVQRSFDAGYETFVLSLADFGARHVQDLANAGAGFPVRPEREDYEAGDPLATPFAPGDTEGLRADIRGIVGGALSCRITLEGRIDVDRACDGVVTLDGEDVPCDAPGGGWRVLDEQTIELLGATCDDLRSGRVSTLEASFPCEVVLR